MLMSLFPSNARTGRAPLGLAVCVLAAAAAVGAMVPMYVSVMEDSLAKLAALPAALLVLMLLCWSRLHLFLAIVLIRASTETLFESTRVSIGGSAIGIGGLLNIAAIAILGILVIERPRIFPVSLAKAWAPFLLLVALGLVTTPDRGAAMRTLLQVISTGAVACGVVYYVRTPRAFRNAIELVVWSSVVPVLYSIWQLATGGLPEYPGEGLRLRSTFSHPNPYAFYLTLVISVTLAMMKSRLFELSDAKKSALGGYLFVLLACLLMTKTRSAWAACAVLFVAYALFFERRYFVYLLLAAVAAFFVPGVGDRLIDLTQGTRDNLSSADKLNSLAWRETLWTAAISWMSPGRYLTGYGLQAFPIYAQVFFRELNTGYVGAHNVYVQVFFDLGAAGIAAFVWLYGRALLGLRLLARVDRVTGFAIIFVVLEFLVVAASDNMLEYLSYNWYLWFIAGAGLAFARLRADASEATPSALSARSYAGQARDPKERR